ncbi:MAG: hypothetical protein Q7T89_02550 [Anaerolineales bacterium]|nr:hypothetical protein [Anaerolineales bacterium]
MKYFSWNEDKNELLKSEKQVSFEDIVFYTEKGFLPDVLEHPNQEKYKGQKIFVAQIDDYILSTVHLVVRCRCEPRSCS